MNQDLNFTAQTQKQLEKHTTSSSHQSLKGAISLKRKFDACVAKGDFEQALHLASANGSGDLFLHDKAVCMMRLGRFAEAVTILRKLVLKSDWVWMREDVPVLYKTNFATALLLSGHPSGCHTTLYEIDDEKNPAVIRLRGIFKEWEKSLSFWQRLDWRWFGIEPHNRPIKFEGKAGEFQQGLLALPPAPLPGSPSHDVGTAA